MTKDKKYEVVLCSASDRKMTLYQTDDEALALAAQKASDVILREFINGGFYQYCEYSDEFVTIEDHFHIIVDDVDVPLKKIAK